MPSQDEVMLASWHTELFVFSLSAHESAALLSPMYATLAGFSSDVLAQDKARSKVKMKPKYSRTF